MSDENTKNMSWKGAIEKVLKDSDSAMHYREIAEKIIEDGLRGQMGATPANSVNTAIRKSMREEGEKSSYIAVGRGTYFLRSKSESSVADIEVIVPEQEDNAIINAFGMFWQRDRVLWSRSANLLGRQQIGADSVNFNEQKGIYILYDGRDVVYVGRVVDRPLGLRLFEHTQDRLQGRWDKFSWFGIFPVDEGGKLAQHKKEMIEMSFMNLIGTLEALLIEGLEPLQNRKRGDGFNALEFIQAEDPEIIRQQKVALWEAMKPS